MIRSTYLVARRDYLGYVTAWGFWLGLLLTPVLLGLGMIAPTWAENQQPQRYFSIIEQGSEFTDAVRAELREDRASRVRTLIAPAQALSDETPPELEAFDAAIDDGRSIEEALEAAGRGGMALPREDYVLVDPPARSKPEIRPYLLGEQELATETGPAPLFAAVFVPQEADGALEYWSENVTATGLLSLIRRAEDRLAETKIFAEAGVSPQILQRAEAAAREITELRARAESTDIAGEVTSADRAPFIASVFMAFLLWFLIFSVVNYLLMGTIEERSNKIFDSLLTSVKLPHLLAGKLIAVLAVALTLMAVWAIGATVLGVNAAGSLPPEAQAVFGEIVGAVLNPGLLVPALLSFVLGYLMFGAVFLALGSLCDTVQEAQTLMTPLIVLLMVPLFMVIVAINDAESPILAVMSWVPVFTPFLLILRIPTGPPLIEILGQLGLMAVSTFAILWLASRVYRAGAVHGAGVNDAARWFAKLIPGRKGKSKA